MLPITTVLAALFGLLYFWLSIQVIRRRRRMGVLIGTGDREDLKWAIRAHGNFAEYVPFSLILLALAEYQGMTPWLSLPLAFTLFSGRVMHAIGFLYCRNRLSLRVTGMTLTFWTILGLSVWNLGHTLTLF